MRPDKTGFHRQQQAPPSRSEAAWFSAPYIMLLLLLFTSVLEEIIAQHCHFPCISYMSSLRDWTLLVGSPSSCSQMWQQHSVVHWSRCVAPQICVALMNGRLLLSHFSRVRLCATPEMAARQAPLSLGFSRQEHWSGLPFTSPMHESEKWKGSRSVVSDPQQPRILPPHSVSRQKCISPSSGSAVLGTSLMAILV